MRFRFHEASVEDRLFDDDRLRSGGEPLVQWPPDSPGEAPTDCVRVGRDYWLSQSGVGALRFRADDLECVAYPAPGIDRTWFEGFVYDTWLNIVFQVWGRQVLHASAVADQETGEAVAFVGTSGAGKSSMAFGLSRRPGWVQVCDDTLAFSCAQQDGTLAIALHHLPNDARLRSATAAHYGRTGQPPRPVRWPSMPLRLKMIFFLKGDEHLPRPAAITPLRLAESYPLLLEEAHAFTLKVPEFNQRLMRDYGDLAAAVPSFRLAYRKSFETVDEVFDAVERHWQVHEGAAPWHSVCSPEGASPFTT